MSVQAANKRKLVQKLFSSCRRGIEALGTMYASVDLAIDLERTLVEGFDAIRISKVAFEIYQNHGLEIGLPMDRILLTLMAMGEGEEFELNESGFFALISEIKAM